MGERGRPGLRFSRARDLFESARAAAIDVETVERQLARMESSALSLGGGSAGSPVSSTPDPQRSARRSEALMDREASLRRRLDEDWALIDLASAVLYGREADAGLAALVPSWWCDAIWWHYLGLASWADAADRVGYSEQRCKQVVMPAFDTIDSWGLVAVMEGRASRMGYEAWERDRRREGQGG